MRTPESQADYTGEGDLDLPPAWRVWWLVGCVAGVGATVLLWRYDSAIDQGLSGLAQRLPGDVRREWSALQQYGQGTASLLIVLVIALMDPLRRRRLWDLGLAAAAVGLSTLGAKVLLGRPRPMLEDPHSMVGVLGVYPVPNGQGGWVLAHSWESAGSPALWSMPSSHTAFAVMLSVFLSALYPRLTWIVLTLACAVAGGRLVFDAHWASDVAAGATVAWAVAVPIVARRVLSRRLG